MKAEDIKKGKQYIWTHTGALVVVIGKDKDGTLKVVTEHGTYLPIMGAHELKEA